MRLRLVTILCILAASGRITIAIRRSESIGFEASNAEISRNIPCQYSFVHEVASKKFVDSSWEMTKGERRRGELRYAVQPITRPCHLAFFLPDIKKGRAGRNVDSLCKVLKEHGPFQTSPEGISLLSGESLACTFAPHGMTGRGS